jgi:hypothetical protein
MYFEKYNNWCSNNSEKLCMKRKYDAACSVVWVWFAQFFIVVAVLIVVLLKYDVLCRYIEKDSII